MYGRITSRKLKKSAEMSSYRDFEILNNKSHNIYYSNVVGKENVIKLLVLTVILSTVCIYIIHYTQYENYLYVSCCVNLVKK